MITHPGDNTHPELGVRAIARADIQALSACFKDAFASDPVMRWVFPSEREWERCGQHYFEVLIKQILKTGYGITTERMAGGALWLRPEIPRTGLLAQILAFARLTWSFRSGFFRGLQIERALQPFHPKKPNWYLSMLCTDQLHRRRGMGAALLTPVLDLCDRDSIPAYLESSNEDNIHFYRHHGFEILAEVTIPGGPTMWPMLRGAR